MKNLKVILFAVVAMFCMNTINAQTQKSKSKTTKSTKTVAAKKYQCPMKCEGDKMHSKAGKCSECGMTMKNVKNGAMAYKCEMKCENDKTYAKAGKCPVCGMTLKKSDRKEKMVDDGKMK
jgi:transcription initiation factor IIE alpha subunit